MLDKSSKDTLLSKANNNAIWEWHSNEFCGYLKLNALSLSFAIYNILNNRGKRLNLNQENISVGRIRIFKKISLLFFGVNVVIKIYEKPKVSIQIIKNAKSNGYKRTNEHWYSRPLWLFLKETETKYEMKTKRILISKEQKQL